MLSNSALKRSWNFLHPKAKALGIISLILLSLFSFALFFYIQQLTQDSIRTTLFEQHSQVQKEVTARISEHIGSDLNLVISTIEGLANSYYLQRGDLHSDNSRALIEEKYRQLNPSINRMFILDKNNIVTVSLAPPNSETFLSADYSMRDWVIITRETLKPVFSDGFERQGIYRIFISYPIVNKDSQEFLGIIAVSIPTVPFFAHYANVEDISSQFLVAFSRDGTLLAVGASQQLVGENFFGSVTQDFINHDPTLNELTRSLLEGNSGSAVYDYGTGERLTTQSPISIQGLPTYFIQLVTPTTQIYSDIGEALSAERTKLFLLLASTMSSIAVLAVFLLKWNSALSDQVKIRTRELELANERLQSNLRSQKEFLSIAAHELRTPIQPILGLSQVLQKMAADPVKSPTIAGLEQRQFLEVISRNARRLQKLTEDLLDVSRIESQSLRLNREKFDLGNIVARTVEDFRSSLADQYTRIDLTAMPSETAFVNADKERIIQVISNLLHNALKFTKEGSISVGMSMEDSKVIVKVCDSGSGVDPEIEPKLFMKFASKSERGTGLGLFISKAIVEAHGGTIWAENNKQGKGATFSFALPIAS